MYYEILQNDIVMMRTDCVRSAKTRLKEYADEYRDATGQHPHESRANHYLGTELHGVVTDYCYPDGTTIFLERFD